VSAAFEIPRDERGHPKPHDHPNFDGQKRVIRRVEDNGVHIVLAKDGVGRRISSAIFKNTKPTPHDYVSCDSENCIIERGFEPKSYVADNPKWCGAIILTAESMRLVEREGHPLSIGMWPLPENHCHGAIWGKINSSRAIELLRNCEWLWEAEGVRIVE
jgi:hypothetical protein